MIENKKNNNNFSFTKENLLLAERELKKYPKGREGSAIISILWIAQRQNKGWLSSDIIDYIAKFLDLPQIRVMEIATFYTMFNLNPVGAHHFQICGTTPCMLSSSEFGWTANMERIMKAQAIRNEMMDQFMSSKKVLELNINHKLILNITNKFNKIFIFSIIFFIGFII